MSERQGLVLDPDTLELPDGTRTRLQGADAWEAGHPAERRGTAVTSRDLDWSSIKPGGKDHYGRTLISARTKDGKDFATYLIEGGYAIPMSGSTQQQANAEQTFAYRAGPGGERFETPEVRRNRELLREEWAGANFPDYVHAVPGGPQERQGTFGSSYRRGVEQNKANVGALTHMLGEWMGVEAVSDWGLDVMEAGESAASRYAPEVGTFTNIEDVDDAWTYAVEALGENVFTLLTMAATAGFGALAARAAAGTMAKKLIEKHGVDAARAKVTALTKAGAVTGTGVASYGMVTGELAKEFEEHGLFNPGLVLGAGVPMAALDTFAVTYIMKPIFSALEKAAMQGVKTDHLTKVVAKSLGAHVTKGFMAEAPTEAMQEAIQLAARTIEDPNFHMWSPEQQENTLVQLIDAFLKGGIVGGAMGTAPGGIQGVRTYGALQQEEEKDPGKARTVPEKDADLSAQIQAHSAGHRGPVWIEGTQEPPNVDAREMGVVAIPEKGVFIVAPDQAEAVRKRVTDGLVAEENVEDIIASVVGYGKPKSQLDQLSTVAVQGLNEAGNVVWTELADKDTLEEAKVRAQKAGGEKGSARVQSVEQALAERAAKNTRQEPPTPKPKGPETKKAEPPPNAPKDMGKPTEKPAAAKPSVVVNETPVGDQQAAKPVLSTGMTFKYGDHKREGVKSKTTFDAILAGERTSTLRLDGWHGTGRWADVKPGQTVRFTSGDGRHVDVVVDSVERVDDFGTLDAEAVSQTEGWSVAQLKKSYLPKGKGGYYVKYHLPSVAEPKADKEADTQKHATGFPQPKKPAPKADTKPASAPKPEASAPKPEASAPKPAPSPEDVEQTVRKLTAELRNKANIGAVLNWIEKVGTPRQKALAAAVRKSVPGILTVATNKGKVSNEASMATAWTVPGGSVKDARIAFNMKELSANAIRHSLPDLIAETALHEILHVAVYSKIGWELLEVAALDNPGAFLELQTVFNAFKKHVESLDRSKMTAVEVWSLVGNASKNLDEFVVMAMSNPTVQEHLAQIQMDGKRTAWDAFVDWFVGVLGLAKEHRTALDEALQLSAALLNLQPSTVVPGKPLDQVKVAVEAEVEGEKIELNNVNAQEALKVLDDKISLLQAVKRCVG